MKKEQKILTAPKEQKKLPVSEIQKILPASKIKKTGPGSNPENKFKKGKATSAATLNNIIKGAVENVKPRSGKGFANEGTVPIYDEER
ncbi:MAG: hypothetical protein ABJB11_13885 [Ferruginibacter sp.]